MTLSISALTVWSILLICLLSLVACQDFFGERPGRCPQYPSAHHTDASCQEKPDCVRDASCPASMKCCENPCGVSKCIQSVVPEVPRIEQEKCPDRGSTDKFMSDLGSGRCKPIQSKFCYRHNCRRCCVHVNDCNPATLLLMTAEECHKVLCQKHPCFKQGSYCSVDEENNEPRCHCNRACNDVTRTVCGTDGVTYKNPCLLDLEACLLGIRIQVSHDGTCPTRQPEGDAESGTLPPIVKPDRAKIDPGESMAFVCRESIPGATIKWYKRRNGREDVEMPVSLTYFKRVKNSKEESERYLFLKIPKASRGNSGQYVCKQKWEGKITQASARLILSWIGKEKIGCDKPPDKGPCHGDFNNYYYDAKDGLCKQFVYGGCTGNENNFENQRDCTLLCKGLKARVGCPQSVETPDYCTSRQDRCSEDKDCTAGHNCCYVGCYKDCYKPVPTLEYQLLRPEEEPCGQRTCKYYSKCQLTIDGNSKECSCPTVCSFENLQPVCGSDQKTYLSECFLRVHACRWQRTVSVAHKGTCRSPSTLAPATDPLDICTIVHCPPYSTCVVNPLDGQPTCICPRFCEFDFQPVCGSDGKTYHNECVMRVNSCKRNLFISKERNGLCQNGFGSIH